MEDPMYALVLSHPAILFWLTLVALLTCAYLVFRARYLRGNTALMEKNIIFLGDRLRQTEIFFQIFVPNPETLVFPVLAQYARDFKAACDAQVALQCGKWNRDSKWTHEQAVKAFDAESEKRAKWVARKKESFWYMHKVVHNMAELLNERPERFLGHDRYSYEDYLVPDVPEGYKGLRSET